MTIADGYHLVIKRDCPTCALLESEIRSLFNKDDIGPLLNIYVQDERTYLSDLPKVQFDSTLEISYKLSIETVPTLIRHKAGKETARSVGWVRKEWRDLLGLPTFGENLPDFKPGCGSLTFSPGAQAILESRFGDLHLRSREIEIGNFDDPIEQAFERGWSDGLPIVPPTGDRIIRMLSGTRRNPEEVVGQIPPNLTECTVEKVAINAVMAGCRPEYMPVLLAALEAALEPNFTLHGLLCTTCFSGPIIIVNGPICKKISMNWGVNALGQGNRANSTIGRALQLIVRNVGGGLPGEIDRATLGNPGKIGFCFAEDETDSTWQPLSQAQGFKPGSNTVTLFPGDGVKGFSDQRSRTPQELTNSLAMALQGCLHPKVTEAVYAMLILSPEHYAIYREAGWDRTRITQALMHATITPGKDLIRGAQGVGEGIDPSRADEMVPKFFEKGLLLVRAGGPAGLFSGILTSWTGTRHKDESKPVTREIII